MRVDLGVLDPEYVNVLPNGHELLWDLPWYSLRENLSGRKSKGSGAKGLRVIASIETGQEMIQRWEEDDVFYGFTGTGFPRKRCLRAGVLTFLLQT